MNNTSSGTRLSRFLRIVIIFVSSLLLVVLICTSVLYFTYLFENFPSGGIDSLSTKYEHQKLQIFPAKDEYSAGVISLDEKLPSRQFLFYFDKSEGNHVLISNFGSKEYSCTGSCMCRGERRSSAAVLSRGLTFLLAAVSSVEAFRLAKGYFSEVCDEEFEDSCSEVSIESEVEDCEPVRFFKGRLTAEQIAAEIPQGDDIGEGEGDMFVCEGVCRTNKDFRTDFYKTPFSEKFAEEVEKLQPEYGCDKIVHKSKVNGNHIYVPDGEDEEVLKEVVLHWTQNHLDPFCRVSTLKKVRSHTAVMCVGRDVSYPHEFSKKNVCRRMEKSEEWSRKKRSSIGKSVRGG